MFFAYAIIASSSVKTTLENPINIYIPENGFISINIPLSPMRMGSLSTKTTHPIYINGLQSILDALGINAKLIQLYQFKTKGEMLNECLNKELLKNLIKDSVSCGKYQRHLTHCGTCVPCLVRRSAFYKAGIPDVTSNGYLHEQISNVESRDISSVAYAYLQYKSSGIKSVTAGHLLFTPSSERSQFENMIARSLDELGEFLKYKGVI
ncbi:MAG: hypothetical protein AAGU14_03940 [Eubacteriaceae bacterium]